MELAIQQHKTLDKIIAARYLSLYLGEPSMGNWITQMDYFYDHKLSLGYHNQDALDLLRKSVAFCIVMKYKERVNIKAPFQGFLHGAEKWPQYNDDDWEAALHKIISEDEQIKTWRNRALSLGVVYPIEYSPVTRQAFNWLYDKAEGSGELTPENKSDIADKLKKLVLAYGGTVICNVFTKHENRINKEVIHWNTNYFFERLIHQIYTIDQIIQLKKAEINRTNPKLVRKV